MLLSEFLSVLEEEARLPNSRITVGGDFNLPDINWDYMMTNNGGRCRSKSDWLLNVLNNCGLEQMVKTPTRSSANTNNILDLIITNIPQCIRKMANCVGISDHLAVTLQLEDISRRPKVRRNIKLFDRADFDLINYHLYQHYLESCEMFASRTVNENWLQFRESIKTVEKLVPNRSVNVNADPPWYSQKLKRLENRQRKLHQKARKLGCDLLLQRYKELRAVVKRAHREAEMQYTGWSINNRTILNCSHFLARRHFFNPFSPKRSIHTVKLPQQQWFANASFVILFRCHFVSPYHVDGSANNVLCRGGLFCEIAGVLAHIISSQVQLEQENSLNSLKRYPKTSWPEGSIHFQRNE